MTLHSKPQPPAPRALPSPAGILHLQYPSRRELTLAFCRCEEFYESGSERIRGRVFTWADWLETYVQADGSCDYFSNWEGFNLPASSFASFCIDFGTHFLTMRERSIRAAVAQYAVAVGVPAQYIIATDVSSPDDTVQHELAHAYWSLSPSYRAQCEAALATLAPEVTVRLCEGLTALGYGAGVLQDEIHAYLRTSLDAELEEMFPTVPLASLNHTRQLLQAVKAPV